MIGEHGNIINMAMQWIRPRIQEIINIIDQNESLLNAALRKEDIVPRIARTYMSQDWVSQINPLALIWLKSMNRDDVLEMAQAIIYESIEEIASTNDESSEIVQVAREHPDWLHDQARRLANLVVLNLMNLA